MIANPAKISHTDAGRLTGAARSVAGGSAVTGNLWQHTGGNGIYGPFVFSTVANAVLASMDIRAMSPIDAAIAQVSLVKAKA